MKKNEEIGKDFLIKCYEEMSKGVTDYLHQNSIKIEEVKSDNRFIRTVFDFKLAEKEALDIIEKDKKNSESDIIWDEDLVEEFISDYAFAKYTQHCENESLSVFENLFNMRNDSFNELRKLSKKIK